MIRRHDASARLARPQWQADIELTLHNVEKQHSARGFARARWDSWHHGGLMPQLRGKAWVALKKGWHISRVEFL
jgi:hypothetical protein